MRPFFLPLFPPTPEALQDTMTHEDSMTPEEDEPAGHYRSAAGALAGMSSIGFTLFIMASWLNLDLGFIDSWGILGISILFASVGGMMWFIVKPE